MKIEELYQKIQHWLLIAGPKFILGTVLLIIGFWLIRLLKKWIRNILSKKSIDHSLFPFFISLVGIILQIVLVVTIMQVMGVEMTIFTTLVGATAVAFGLALSGTLQNFTSGILILLLKPYRVGDIIVAQGQEGIVSSIQLFYSVVTTFDNKTVIIPNSKLSNEVIINLSREGKRRLDMELKFNFGFDFENIKSIIFHALETDKRILEGHKPEVGISTIDPDGFKVMIYVWVDATTFQECKFEIQKKLIDELKKEGIKLPGM